MVVNYWRGVLGLLLLGLCLFLQSQTDVIMDFPGSVEGGLFHIIFGFGFGLFKLALLCVGGFLVVTSYRSKKVSPWEEKPKNAIDKAINER